MRYVVDINASTCSSQFEVEADSIEDAIREAMRQGDLYPSVLSGNEPKGEHTFDAVRRDQEAIRRLGASTPIPHLGQWVRVSFNVLVGGYVESCYECGKDMEVDSAYADDDNHYCSYICRAEAASCRKEAEE